jgi:uncharacterized membrane protein/rubredoxin
MSELMRCKACGFIADNNNIKRVCPACGLPKTVFEPWKEKISKKRKMLLELNLHPISVHFPQAIASFIPLFIIGYLFLEQEIGIQLLTASKILAWLFPFSVIGAIIAGLFDGKIRLKKLTTPFLKRKIILGTILFIFSSVIFALVVSQGLEQNNIYLILGLSIAAIVCQVFLGKIGSKLMYTRLNG